MTPAAINGLVFVPVLGLFGAIVFLASRGWRKTFSPKPEVDETPYVGEDWRNDIPSRWRTDHGPLRKD